MPAALGVLPVAHSAPQITESDILAISTLARSGWIAQGGQAAAFSQALRDAHDARSVSLASSGTAGIVLALRALGIVARDEVVLPSYVCGSVREAVLLSGAVPVLCDIGERWVATTETIDAVITPRTRAIIAVNIFGLPADIDAINALGYPVIDDRCQSFGLPREHGHSAAYSVCSFHAAKCLAAGEGGAVIAWNDQWVHRLDRAASSSRRTFGVFSDLQALLAREQLERWPLMKARRSAIATRYLDALPEARTASLRAASSAGSVWFRFPVTLRSNEQFDTMRARFAQLGVQVRRGVDALLHRDAELPDVCFPNTVRTYERTLSLPIWPAMSDRDVDHVIEVATDVLGS